MSEPEFIKLNNSDSPERVEFTVDPQQAIRIFVKMLLRNKLNSTQMLDAAQMGKIRAEYMPVCLLECNAVTNASAQCTLRKDETAENYSAQRTVESKFSQIILSAGKIADDTLLHLLEPYELEKAGEPGIPLENVRILKADLAPEELFERVKPELEKRIEEQVRVSLNEYTDHTVTGMKHEFGKVYLRYFQLPVWVLENEENGRMHRLFINGQTGKTAGVAPKSRQKLLALLVAAAAAGAVTGQIIWMAVNALL